MLDAARSMSRIAPPLTLALIGLVGCGGGSGGGDPAGDGSSSIDPPGTEEPAGRDALRLIEIVTQGDDGRRAELAYEWDSVGRLVGQRLRQPGASVERRRFEWPDDLRFTRREDDEGDDGRVERTLDYTFDPEGRLAGARVSAPDGTTLETRTYTVGDDGLVESLVRERDGLPLSRQSFDYNDGGELQSALVDSDGDGVADRVRGYDYDQAGVVAGTTVRSLVDDTVLEQATWRYERGACIRTWMNSVFRPICVVFR